MISHTSPSFLYSQLRFISFSHLMDSIASLQNDMLVRDCFVVTLLAMTSHVWILRLRYASLRMTRAVDPIGLRPPG